MATMLHPLSSAAGLILPVSLWVSFKVNVAAIFYDLEALAALPR